MSTREGVERVRRHVQQFEYAQPGMDWPTVPAWAYVANVTFLLGVIEKLERALNGGDGVLVEEEERECKRKIGGLG